MRRKLFHTLLRHLRKREFSLVTGARHTGKTTLLRQIEKFCIENQIPVKYLDCADRTIQSQLNRDPHKLLNDLPYAARRTVILTDNIQHLRKPLCILDQLFNEKADRVKIVASSLRSFPRINKPESCEEQNIEKFSLQPCSFDEYLELTGKKFPKEEALQPQGNATTSKTNTDELDKAWEDYLLYGGYPAVIVEPDPQKKIQILNEYRDTFLLSDAPAAGVQNIPLFTNLVKALAQHSGELINVNGLASSFQTPYITISHYLEVMERINHLHLIKPFSQNKIKELKKQPKGFLTDTGIRNAILNNFEPFSIRTDRESLWTTAFLRQLLDKFPLETVCYWQITTKQKIHFVLPETEFPMAILGNYTKKSIIMRDSGKFEISYPEIPLEILRMDAFDETMFKKLFR